MGFTIFLNVTFLLDGDHISKLLREMFVVMDRGFCDVDTLTRMAMRDDKHDS